MIIVLLSRFAYLDLFNLFPKPCASSWFISASSLCVLFSVNIMKTFLKQVQNSLNSFFFYLGEKLLYRQSSHYCQAVNLDFMNYLCSCTNEVIALSVHAALNSCSAGLSEVLKMIMVVIIGDFLRPYLSWGSTVSSIREKTSNLSLGEVSRFTVWTVFTSERY